MMRVSVEKAAELVSEGGVVVYPTETVYGVGGDAFNEDAVRRVYKVKERPRERAVSVAVSDTAAAQEVARMSDQARDFVTEFLPGPVTPLLPRRRELPEVVTAGGELVGVRVPDDGTARTLLDQTGPLTSTSANRSGESAATRAEDLGELGDTVDGVIDDGPRESTGGVGSTVVDTTTWEVVREGAAADAVYDWLEANV